MLRSGNAEQSRSRIAFVASLLLALLVAGPAIANQVRSGMQITVNPDDTVAVTSMGSTTIPNPQLSLGFTAPNNPYPYINGWQHVSGAQQYRDNNNNLALVIGPSGADIVRLGAVVNSNGEWFSDNLVLTGSTALGAALRASYGAGGPGSSSLFSGEVIATDTDNNDDFTVSGTVSFAAPPTPDVDIQVAVADSVDPVIAGAGSGAVNLVHTITARNLSMNPATGLAVSFAQMLPSGVTPGMPVPSGATMVAGTTWTIGNLGPGASATLELPMTVGANANESAVATTNAMVAMLNESDTDSTNDGGLQETTVATVADLRIDSPAPGSAVAGTQITYTILVENEGPSAATAVSVPDPTPAGFTFASATAPCSGGFPCQLGDLAPNDDVSFDVTYDIDSSTIGIVTNTSTVSSSTTDPVVGNNSSSAFTVVSAQADMGLSKLAPPTAVAGDELTYIIAIENNGPSVATDVTVTDMLPAGVNLIRTLGCAEDPVGVPTCTLGTQEPNFVEAVQVVVDIDSAFAGELVNSATVSSTTADPVGGNESDAVTTTVTAEADLSIIKTGPDTANAGEPISYNLVVTNDGPSDALSVSIADTLPAGVTLVSTTGCAEDPSGVPTCSLGTLAANGSANVTVTVDIDSAFVGELVNSATVSSTTTDPVGGNETDTVTTTVTAEADLSITKTGPATANAGEQISYDLVVTNDGPSDALSVSIADTLPAGVTLVDTTGCTEDPSGVPTCTLGTLAADASAAVTVTVDIDPATLGDIINSATVSSSTTDPVGGNETDAVTTTVAAEADLALTKSGPMTAAAGTAVSYTIDVTNNGPSDATGVTITDTLPAGVTLVGTTGCAEDPVGVPTCTVGTLAADDSATVTVTVDIDPATLGDITNSATVSSAATDPVGGNDTGSATTQITAEADLAITKTSDVSSVEIGGTVVYTLLVENAGPSDATNVVITDNLPVEQALLASSGCFEDPSGAPTCSIGTLAAGTSTSVTLTAQVVRPGVGFQRNTASVSSDASDTVSANNEGTADVMVVYAIPTLNLKGLILMTLLLITFGWLGIRRGA